METAKEIIQIVLYLISALVALYFIVPIILFLTHLLPFKKKYHQVHNRNFDFAAIITAHEDLRCVPPLVDSLLKQRYSEYIIYVVADACEEPPTFNDSRVVVLHPSVPFHSKIRSIKFAVENFRRQHDALVIFDSDNLVHPDYFMKLNGYFQNGFRVVQTHMLSKNTDSTYARLDSIGHIYNTFLERQVKMERGWSSAILGLGIAIDLDLYNEVMYRDNLGGFDKKMQVQLAKKVQQIGFAEDAIVYDEKVEDGATLEKQRTRWINTYFKYFKDSLSLLLHGFRTFNMGRILLGFVMLRPPLFLLTGAALMLAITGIWVNLSLTWMWLILLGLFALNFAIIIITQSRQPGMATALLHLPKVAIRQVRSLLRMKSAARSFLKTEHNKVIYIDELLKNEFK